MPVESALFRATAILFLPPSGDRYHQHLLGPGLLADAAEGKRLETSRRKSTMLIGAHSIIYSTDPEADRAFLRDILKLTHVDVGDGWLIFGLPPSEVAIHPAEANGEHEFFFMVDDAEGFIANMRRRNIDCSDAQDRGWGVITQLTLPGGGALHVYEPRHERPRSMPARTGSRRRVTRTSKKSGATKKAARPKRKVGEKTARKATKKTRRR